MTVEEEKLIGKCENCDEIKQQSNEKAMTKEGFWLKVKKQQQTDEHSKTKQKPIDRKELEEKTL